MNNKNMDINKIGSDHYELLIFSEVPKSELSYGVNNISATAKNSIQDKEEYILNFVFLDK
ncbi:MAG: hypothetical protein ISS14_05165 [Actinobacteria bacterium]|nr:hypothetical protein [Actinomycetota bacterium]MBL7124261.1 hypothetical protein [Actinomycetota bacterium]